jgi:hypothetical protein
LAIVAATAIVVALVVFVVVLRVVRLDTRGHSFVGVDAHLVCGGVGIVVLATKGVALPALLALFSMPTLVV